MIDRSEVNRALAKALAYQQCGKQRQAEMWACQLVKLLECAGILNDEATCPDVIEQLSAVVTKLDANHQR